MKTDKATVTIPYDEFAKHQEQLKEIEWAREIKKKMDAGELIETKKVAKNLMVLGEYAFVCHISSSMFDKPNFELFASQRGFNTRAETIAGTETRIFTLIEKE